MPHNPDTGKSPASAFSHDPETQRASLIILVAASGFNLSSESLFDEQTKLKWQGVRAQIEGVGPEHGKAILRLLNPLAQKEGISLMIVKEAIEMYCNDHRLPIPEIPDNAKTLFDGAFGTLHTPGV